MRILKVNIEIIDSDQVDSIYDLISSIINKSNDKFFCVNSILIDEKTLFEKEKGFIDNI